MQIKFIWSKLFCRMIAWPGIGNNNTSIIVKIVLFTCNSMVFSYKVNFIVQSLLLARLHLRDRSFSLRLIFRAEVGEAFPWSTVLKSSKLLSHLERLDHHTPNLFIVTDLEKKIFCFFRPKISCNRQVHDCNIWKGE